MRFAQVLGANRIAVGFVWKRRSSAARAGAVRADRSRVFAQLVCAALRAPSWRSAGVRCSGVRCAGTLGNLRVPGASLPGARSRSLALSRIVLTLCDSCEDDAPKLRRHIVRHLPRRQAMPAATAAQLELQLTSRPQVVVPLRQISQRQGPSSCTIAVGDRSSSERSISDFLIRRMMT